MVMESIEHDGRATAYRVANRGADGPPVLFVHGSGGDHGIWKSQDRLARSYPVISLDLSGHGRSIDIDTDAGPLTLDAYADDVAAVADATDASVLVGNSLGGAVILRGLLTGALDPSAASLVGSGAKLAVLDDLRKWLATDFERAVDFLHGPDRLFTGEVDSRLVAASRETMFEVGRAITERDFLSCHTFDVRDRLGEIELPVLAIGGDRDGLTPPSYHEYLATELPNGELELIEDAAHLVMLEQPERFNEVLSEFLDRVDHSVNRSGST